MPCKEEMGASRQMFKLSKVFKNNALVIIIAIICTSFVTLHWMSRPRSRPFVRYEKQFDYYEDKPPSHIILEKIGISPKLEDNRPSMCTDAELYPNFKRIRENYPDLKIKLAMMINNEKKFVKSIASILLTVDLLPGSMISMVVVPDNDNFEKVQKIFDIIENDHHVPITVLKPAQRATLFQEELEVAESTGDADIVVFMTSELLFTPGWLEALVNPLLRNNDDSFIVSPHFTNFKTKGKISIVSNETRTPIWKPVKPSNLFFDDYKEFPTTAFLPDCFAVNRNSPNFIKAVKFFNEYGITDTTSLDAAMFSWRCLNAPILMSPCSQVTLPNGEFADFEPPRQENNRFRINLMWFENIFGFTPAADYIGNSCSSLKDFAQQQEISLFA